jgi:hypothetical protein
LLYAGGIGLALNFANQTQNFLRSTVLEIWVNEAGDEIEVLHRKLWQPKDENREYIAYKIADLTPLD